MTLADPLSDLLIEMSEAQEETQARLERMVQVGIIKPDSITDDALFCTVIVKTDERSVEYEDVRLPFYLHLVDLAWQLVDVHQTREQVIERLVLQPEGGHGGHANGSVPDHAGHVQRIIYPSSGNTPNAAASPPTPARQNTTASDVRSKPYPRPDNAVPASVFNPVLGGRACLVYISNGLEEGQRYILSVY